MISFDKHTVCCAGMASNFRAFLFLFFWLLGVTRTSKLCSASNFRAFLFLFFWLLGVTRTSKLCSASNFRAFLFLFFWLLGVTRTSKLCSASNFRLSGPLRIIETKAQNILSPDCKVEKPSSP